MVCLIDKNGKSIWNSFDPLNVRALAGVSVANAAIESERERVFDALARCVLRQEIVEYEIVGVAATESLQRQGDNLIGKFVPHRVKLLPADCSDIASVCVCHSLPENFSEITEEECQIVALLAEDHTLKEIAELVFLSESAIDTKIRHLKGKLGVKNIGGLVAKAIRNGLI